MKSKTKTPDPRTFLIKDIDGNQFPLSELLTTSAAAWRGSASDEVPPTLGHLVEALTAIACNRYKRIRQLESHIISLLELHRPR